MTISVTELEEARKLTLPMVEAFLRNRSIDPSLAEDLLQEAVMNVWNRKTSEEIENLRGYLYTICKNIFYREGEKGRYYLNRMITIDSSGLKEKIAFYDDMLERLERSDNLRDIFQRATELEKLIIHEILLSDQNTSVRKIAEQLEKRYDGLNRYRIKVAIQRLKEKISKIRRKYT